MPKIPFHLIYDLKDASRTGGGFCIVLYRGMSFLFASKENVRALEERDSKLFAMDS